MFRSISSTSLNSTEKTTEYSHENTTDSIQKSHTTAKCIVEKKHGFKPSDRHDPTKKLFLTQLCQQIWQKKNDPSKATKEVDLRKIFTPATDTNEVSSKTRKLYASSAFYSPALHPTVEDQVKLARKISHSLSDISNQQSRGQSMYVNRKKRSIKWVHEGCGQDKTIKASAESTNGNKFVNETDEANNLKHHDKMPLKFLMNPCPQVRDMNSLRESINTETGLLSPDVSAEIVAVLQTQRGKDYRQYEQPKPPTSPNILPAYTDAAKHRVQLNLHQEQLLEKYAKPALKVVQTPWEAALSSGSASTAFVEVQKTLPYSASTITPTTTPQFRKGRHVGISTQTLSSVPDSYDKLPSTGEAPRYSLYVQPQPERQCCSGTNVQKELAYKPSIPQGWKAPSMHLPKNLYMPKEVSLQNYAPPPPAIITPLVPSHQSEPYYAAEQFTLSESALPTNRTLPARKPSQPGFSTTYGEFSKQPYLPPQSYQTVSQSANQNMSQIGFNPLQLSYYKLARFENQFSDDVYPKRRPSRASCVILQPLKIRNTSPTSFVGSYQRSCNTPSESIHHGISPSCSQSPFPLFKATYSEPRVSFTVNQLLNAPNFNNSARGWGASTGNHFKSHQAAVDSKSTNFIDTAGIPYTDF